MSATAPWCSAPTARSAIPRRPLVGTDSFTYHASDGSPSSNVATVTITVTAVDDAPVCLDGGRTTAEDTVLADSVACTDSDSASLTYALGTDVTHGSLTLIRMARSPTRLARLHRLRQLHVHGG